VGAVGRRRAEAMQIRPYGHLGPETPKARPLEGRAFRLSVGVVLGQTHARYVGRVVEATENDDGLAIRCRFDLDTKFGKSDYRNTKGRRVSGLKNHS
jgi:hypothetical protein